MNIVIAGGTGFLGQALIESLVAEGDLVTVLSRRAQLPQKNGVRTVAWQPDGTVGSWSGTIDGANAVINLAGESIAGGRWTTDRKRRILESRVLATRSLALAIRTVEQPPSLLLSGSAVGYYGACGSEIVSDDHPPGTDFLAGVCRDWEREAAQAESAHTRVVCIRTGLVLARRGGALPKMLPPFWLGAGGPVGSGRQYWPWIHLLDWIGLVRLLVRNGSASGALNASAPIPVTNADFARALGRAIHRPSVVPTPGFALKLLLGEMAEALLLSGQRAVPIKAGHLGYRFTFRDLESALEDIFRNI